MPNYRRANACGGTYFFTVVTYRRRKILTEPESREALMEAVEKVRTQYPFTVDGWVLLPDHIHTIWTMPPNDNDFSKRWGMIKAEFTKRTKQIFRSESGVSGSKISRRESTIWQRRFWEHQIRDDRDFEKHMDYLLFNPVKHGLVTKVKDWPYSTFHRLVKRAVLPEDWGGNVAIEDECVFGE